MEFEDENGFLYELNENNLTASVKKIKKEISNILIPRFVEKANKEYIITTIKNYAFTTKNERIGPISVKFPEDSEVKIMNVTSFSCPIIDIHMPPSLEIIEEAEYLYYRKTYNDKIRFYITSNNHNFLSPDNKYLLCKSQKDLDDFDTLIYVSPDVKEAIIPPNIKIIKKYALTNCQSLKLTNNSQLETIEGHQTSNLSKFFIPKNLQNFDEYFFANITEIDLSSQNPLFQIIDDNYLLKKSDTKSDIYDELVWANRQLNNTIIPRYIKKIYPFAIFCKLFSPQISFEEGSIIETIDIYFFPYDCNYEKIVFPSSVKVVKNNAIERCKLLLTIIFQSEE